MIRTTLYRALISSRTPTGFGPEAKLLRSKCQYAMVNNSPSASAKIGVMEELEALEELETLDAGWDGEDAPAIDSRAIAWARSFIMALAKYIPGQRLQSDIPAVSPTPEGGVSLSWNFDGVILWLIIHPNSDVFTYVSKGYQARALRRMLGPEEALEAVLTGLGVL